MDIKVWIRRKEIQYVGIDKIIEENEEEYIFAFQTCKEIYPKKLMNKIQSELMTNDWVCREFTYKKTEKITFCLMEFVNGEKSFRYSFEYNYENSKFYAQIGAFIALEDTKNASRQALKTILLMEDWLKNESPWRIMFATGAVKLEENELIKIIKGI